MNFADYVQQSHASPRPVTEPIPVTVITGFLGAGKTTLLNRLLNDEHGLRIAVMVNDFGAVNIDTQLITSMQDNVVSLANGCICCTIQGSMVGEIEKLLAQPGDLPEHIVIEASGVADPAGIVRGLGYPQLRSVVRIDSVLALLDAAQFGSLRGPMARLAREQLSIADIVIINKTDLVTPAELAALKETWLFPRARVIEASWANVPLELILTTTRDERAGRGRHAGNNRDAHHHMARHDHDGVFASWQWSSPAPLDLQRLRATIRTFPPTVYRGKGIVYLADQPDKRAILHLVGSRLELVLDRSWGASERSTQLVFIGESGGATPEELSARLDYCA